MTREDANWIKELNIGDPVLLEFTSNVVLSEVEEVCENHITIGSLDFMYNGYQIDGDNYFDSASLMDVNSDRGKKQIIVLKGEEKVRYIEELMANEDYETLKKVISKLEELELGD